MIPAALSRYRVRAFPHHGYWADVGTIGSFYDANIMLTRSDAAFNFYDPTYPIYTHARFLPPSKLVRCQLNSTSSPKGVISRMPSRRLGLGIRTSIGFGCRIERSVLLGSDYYESGASDVSRCRSASAAMSCSTA